MGTLVPYDVKNITANYSSTAKQLSVTANALLPVPFLGAEFKKVVDGSTGGRKLRLEGVTGGLGPPKQVMMLKPYTEDSSTPPRFSAVFIILLDPVKKIETIVSVNVTIDAPVPTIVPVPLKPQPLPVLSTKPDPSALKAIEISLPPQNFVRITAPTPDNATARAIEGRNEGDATYTFRAGELPGFVYWDITWAGNGAGVDKGATFTVTTTALKGTLTNGVTSQAGGASSQVTVQPYAIKLPVNKNLVDLFDPDA